MNGLMVLGVVAIVIQFTIERIKIFLPEKARDVTVPIIALSIGIIVSWSTGTALMGSIGIPVLPVWIDYIVTGIAFSGGSVAFNELIKLITELRPSNAGEDK